jgi:hypothetical protein
MDENRAGDGRDLRYRFAYEMGYATADIRAFLDDGPCSVLEMMTALAARCEEHIMGDPDIGNRISRWFWAMIQNLGLSSMDDEHFDEGFTDRTLARFLAREYGSDGEGGLFMVKNAGKDMRGIEIWYQMMMYLNEYVRK